MKASDGVFQPVSLHPNPTSTELPMSLIGNIPNLPDLSKLFMTPLKGTSGDDTVHISKASGILGALGYYDVEVNGKHQLMSKSQLEHTDFQLGSGDDKIIVDSNVDADITAHGGSGDDTMIGGKGDDHFDGGSGDDKIYGRDGKDTLTGGSGDDYVDGGSGKDKLDGGSGNNTVKHDLADFLPLPPFFKLL
jgi:Ca2+-binding RTX toxin-like protein